MRRSAFAITSSSVRTRSIVICSIRVILISPLRALSQRWPFNRSRSWRRARPLISPASVAGSRSSRIPDFERLWETFSHGLIPGVNIMGHVGALAGYRDGREWLRPGAALPEEQPGFSGPISLRRNLPLFEWPRWRQPTRPGSIAGSWNIGKPFRVFFEKGESGS